MEHARNYKVFVNGKPMDFFFSVNSISDSYIQRGKDNFIKNQTNLGKIKIGDNIQFKFMYCNI